MKVLKIGTRKSALAEAQSEWVANELRAAFPDLKIELVGITTTGDASPPAPLPTGEGGRRPGEANLKALFTKELEEALLDNRIDMAVHSLKDMAADLPKGLVLGAVPERQDPRDVWISKNKTAFQNIPMGSKIGTGAVRRQAQLSLLRPDLTLVPMRGNVDTRLRKLKEEALEGIILALAGLKRLGREKEATEVLAIETMLPALGQGALAIEVRQNDSNVMPYLKSIDHPASHQTALAERAFLKALGGSCQTPIAGYASLESGHLVMLGLVLSQDGKTSIKSEERGRSFDAAGVGERLAQKLLAAGADKILQTNGFSA